MTMFYSSIKFYLYHICSIHRNKTASINLHSDWRDACVLYSCLCSCDVCVGVSRIFLQPDY